ncbi:hypothetical protein CTEN210_17605 [Chaetoceros tenuissimus]|uniref:Uncharacterized protein n=1 Tax=Chaetoceros tenuissimus TaxID=426638 RepID=A0AAD3HFD6_9STRA|nr:hypothetical protein CTEN210_17605 [Chaetoceros tenuissimus]
MQLTTFLSKHLYPKEFEIACDNQFSIMFNFHGQDCGATSQEELQSKMGSQGQKEIFSVIGVDSKPMTKRQQKDRNNHRKETKVMNNAVRGGPSSRQEPSRLEAVRSIQRHSKFGKKTCPRVLEGGRVCGGYIYSGGVCPTHGGGERKMCPQLLDNGRVCGKTIISGGHCPAHGGGSKGRCPQLLENGRVCGKTIISGGLYPAHGGGERKSMCPQLLDNGRVGGKHPCKGGFCTAHGGGKNNQNKRRKK